MTCSYTGTSFHKIEQTAERSDYWERSIEQLLGATLQDLQKFEMKLRATDEKDADEEGINALGCVILSNVACVVNRSLLLMKYGQISQEFYSATNEKIQEYCGRAKRLFGESLILLGYGKYAQNQRQRLAELRDYMPLMPAQQNIK